MRPLLPCLFAVLLGGCAGHSQDDLNGVWINQAAIDAATQGGSLREALLAYGPVLEWQIDSRRQAATFTNGFELPEGRLSATEPGSWQVLFDGDYRRSLQLEDGNLVQSASESGPDQHFTRATATPPAGAPVGSSFERALYQAYLGGEWAIVEGPGEGGSVLFQADGRLEGLPGTDRYALCLAGDCASMVGERDSLWLQQGNQGSVWIFVRDDDELQIFEAHNRAQSDEMPEYGPGPRRWLLELD
ncbi:MAG: hypothetical protein ABWY06_15405 [Pseudomonas sp.]|uniref:hypothetical protein n=1 Tax=Pseudomonas sp. TaxID=306 RepID=UPI00339983F8